MATIKRTVTVPVTQTVEKSFNVSLSANGNTFNINGVPHFKLTQKGHVNRIRVASASRVPGVRYLADGRVANAKAAR